MLFCIGTPSHRVGSQWEIPTKIRYIEAKGNPGADTDACPLAVHAPNRFQPVFPRGTRRFCVLKPGYPTVPADLETVVNATRVLCNAAILEQLPVNWRALCHEPAVNETTMTQHWTGVYEYLGHLVGLHLSAIGYSGTHPLDIDGTQRPRGVRHFKK